MFFDHILASRVHSFVTINSVLYSVAVIYLNEFQINNIFVKIVLIISLGELYYMGPSFFFQLNTFISNGTHNKKVSQQLLADDDIYYD